jgi:transposase-like protein
VADVCRQLGISEATFYVWKKKYGSLGATESRSFSCAGPGHGSIYQ